MITWNFPPKRGGMENLIYDIFTHLSRYYDIEVIGPPAPGGDTGLCHIHRPHGGGFVFFNFFALIKGIFLLLKKRPIIIFGGSLTVSLALVALKLFFRIKCVVYVHGLDVIYGNRFYQMIVAACVPMIDGFICNSRNTEALLRKQFKNVSKVTVIPPGISPPDIQPPSPRSWSRRYLLSVGRLVERKGLVEFIENSFVQIAQVYDDVDLLIVGDEPQEAMYHQTGYKAKVLACIEKNNLQDRVQLLGWVDDDRKNNFYQHCECLVFPVIPSENDVEGFGMVAIEAGIMGRPTIAFDTGGINDAIIRDSSGILVDAFDYECMAEKVRDILNGDLFSDSSAITEAVEGKYRWNNLVRRYMDFLSEKAMQ